MNNRTKQRINIYRKNAKFYQTGNPVQVNKNLYQSKKILKIKL